MRGLEGAAKIETVSERSQALPADERNHVPEIFRRTVTGSGVRSPESGVRILCLLHRGDEAG